MNRLIKKRMIKQEKAKERKGVTKWMKEETS